MGILQSLKNIVSREKQEQQEQEEQNKIVMKDKDIRNVDKRRDHDAQMANAQLKKYEAQEQAQENAQDRGDVTQYLKDQSKKLMRENLEGRPSLGKVLKYVDEYDILLASRDKSTIFSVWKDLVPDDTGILYLISEKVEKVETDEGTEYRKTGEENIELSGPTLGRIFASPQGLLNEIRNGMVTINKNQDGGYLSGPETVQVPEMIVNDGKIVSTEDHTVKYTKKLANLSSQVNTLRNKNAFLESSLMDAMGELENMERILETTNTIKESNKEALESKLDQMNDILFQHDDMKRNISRMSMMNDTWEDITSATVNITKDEAVDRLVEKIDRKDIDMAKSDFKDAMQFLMNNEDALMEMRQMQQGLEMQRRQNPGQQSQPEPSEQEASEPEP